MPKPPLPTQQQMRDYCRATKGHYTNLSRWRLIQQWGPKDTEHVNRKAAEAWEANFLDEMTPAEQNDQLDWYIDRFKSVRDGQKSYDRAGHEDPDAEYPMYALVGYGFRDVRYDTCRCKVFLMNETVGGPRTFWLLTYEQCPEHTATEQALFDAIHGEASRKSVVLQIIESLIDLETREDRTTWAFSTDRLTGSDERVLDVTIAGSNTPTRRSIQDAAELQFGPGSVRVA